MKCPKCQTENREGAKFCKKCGGNWSFSVRPMVIPIKPTASSAANAATNYPLPLSPSPNEKGGWFLERTRSVPSYVGSGKVAAARSRVMNSEKDVDLESLYVHSRNNGIKAVESQNSMYIGEILLNIDDRHMPEAERWVQKAIEADQRNGMRFYLGKDYALYAELFKKKGDHLKAQENLGKAIEILKECGADGWVSKYEKELVLL